MAEDTARAGLGAPPGPVEYGVTGWSEIAAPNISPPNAPLRRAGPLADGAAACAGPCIIGHGTPEQKAYYLHAHPVGRRIWCQGYFQPGSGSDLASLRASKPSPMADDYILNGTKIWKTHAPTPIACLSLCAALRRGSRRKHHVRPARHEPARHSRSDRSSHSLASMR